MHAHVVGKHTFFTNVETIISFYQVEVRNKCSVCTNMVTRMVTNGIEISKR